MPKRKAQNIEVPFFPPIKSREGTYRTVKGSIQRGVEFTFAAELGAKSK